jgi:uncharacterized protein (TIGR03435 family)
MARLISVGKLANLIVFTACAGFGQSTSPPPEFQVAEVRVNDSGQAGVQGGILPGGQVSVRNITLKELIVQAYEAGDLAGGPSWLDSDRFDIIAKAPPNTPDDTLRLMLQTLLTERFKLAIHREQKILTVYALVAAKGGFKLQAAAGSGQPKCGPGQGAEGLNHLVCTNFTMADLTAWLPTRIAPSYIDRPVVDLTGLKGAYDIKLDWVPRPPGGNPATDGAIPVASDVAAGATVFDALDKQLGLKLEERKQPMPVIVIDHIERVPTEN